MWMFQCSLCYWSDHWTPFNSPRMTIQIPLLVHPSVYNEKQHRCVIDQQQQTAVTPHTTHSAVYTAEVGRELQWSAEDLLVPWARAVHTSESNLRPVQPHQPSELRAPSCNSPGLWKRGFLDCSEKMHLPVTTKESYCCDKTSFPFWIPLVQGHEVHLWDPIVLDLWK